ncbi:MAG TPA: hypothetical protein VLT47_10860 [Anaeromyxobacteraceae bacterium]|nr:hypothetical protein [Anaeromyxobacteraceae bacterium]
MSDTAAPNASFAPSGDPGGPFEIVLSRFQPLSSQIGRGQFATLNSSGQATLNGGAYVWPAGIGYPSQVSSSDGAPVALFQGLACDMVQSTGVGEGFTDGDVCVPFWIKDALTPCKLPVSGGVDLAIGGLVLGMRPGSTTQPRLMSGEIAGLLGLAAHSLLSESAGVIAYAADASATTDLASSSNPFMVPRRPLRGKILSIEIIPSAALAATSGNDTTITIVKVDTTGGVALASSPTVATFTTTTALVAGQPAKFTLSGTAANLKLRTTDVLAYYRTHAGSGAVIPQSAIRANLQVI